MSELGTALYYIQSEWVFCRLPNSKQEGTFKSATDTRVTKAENQIVMGKENSKKNCHFKDCPIRNVLDRVGD